MQGNSQFGSILLAGNTAVLWHYDFDISSFNSEFIGLLLLAYGLVYDDFKDPLYFLTSVVSS